MSIQLIIFDSDGVLVDSEAISNRLLCKVINDLGLKISFEETLCLFKGKKLADSLKIIERRIGKNLPLNFENVFRALQASSFQQDLKPIDGVKTALDHIKLPMCVASNGPLSKIKLALQLTGLLPYFRENIFSAYEVGIWKPDPGLFLHAAKTMGVDPSECIVIEDSLSGVQGAISAQMKVLGYAPEVGERELLQQAGAQVFEKMEDLPKLLEQFI